MVRTVLVGLVLGLCAQDAQANPQLGEGQTSLSVFAGHMTNDGWETVVLRPSQIDWVDDRVLGLAVARDWAIQGTNLRFGVEGSLVKHTGPIQDHVEVNAPLTLRYRAPDPVIPVQGAAFGLGLSYAGDRPQVEVARKGDSQKLLAHWFAEVELGTPDWAVAPFVRLHHRSDGYIIAPFDTGSNAVVVGLRYRF